MIRTERSDFHVLDTTLTDKDNSQIWANFGKQTAISTVTTVATAGTGLAVDGVGECVANRPSECRDYCGYARCGKNAWDLYHNCGNKLSCGA